MLTILTEAVLGSLTGYVTNDIAIRQLFRRGGIVEREREEFTEMLISMLSKEVLSPKVMATLFERPEIEAIFHELAIEIVDEILPEALADVRLGQDEGGAELYNAFKERNKAIQWSALHWNSDALAERFAEFLDSGRLQQVVRTALRDMAEHSPNDLGLWPTVRSRIMLHPLLNNHERMNWLTAHETDFRQEAQQVLEGLIKGKSWQEKSIGQLFHLEAEQVSSFVLNALSKQDDTEAYLLMIRQILFTTELREWAENCLCRLIEEMVAIHLYDVMTIFADALQTDRKEIEEMVIRSVQVALKGAGFESSVLRAVRHWFADVEDGNWLNHLLIKELRTKRQRMHCAWATEHLTSLLLAKLQRLWADDKTVIEFSAFIQEHGEKLIRPLFLPFFEQLLAMTPAQLFPELHADQIVDKIWQVLWRLADDERWEELLKAKVAIAMARPLKESFLREEWQQHILAQLNHLADSFDPTWLEKELDKRPLATAEVVELLGRWIFRLPMAQGAGIFLSQKPMHDALQEAFAADILEQVLDTLPGKLADITRDQLEALTHDEMRELALSVIGKEMRPLAWLGGGVGAVVGAASGVALTAGGVSIDPANAEAMESFLLFGARCGLYGSVGYGTNVLAVRGLFKPYHKKFGFQGLLPKNQERFAREMQSLAGDYVINEDIWRAVQGELAIHALDQAQARMEAAAHQWVAHAKRVQPGILRRIKSITAEPLRDQLDVHHLMETALAKILSSDWLILAGREQLSVSLLSFFATAKQKGQWQAGAGTKLVEQLTEADWTPLKRMAIEAVSLRLAEKNGLMFRDWLSTKADNIRLPKAESPFYDQLWARLSPLLDQLPKLLSQKAGKLSKDASRVLRKDLSFSKDLMFRLASGDLYIRNAIIHFAQEELPNYIATRRPHYGEAFHVFCHEKIAAQSLADIGVMPSLEDGQILFEVGKDEKRLTELADWLQSCCCQAVAELLQVVNGEKTAELLKVFLTGDATSGLCRRVDDRLRQELLNLSPQILNQLAHYLEDGLSSPLADSLARLRLSDIIDEDSLEELYRAFLSPLSEEVDEAFHDALAKRLNILLVDSWPLFAPLMDRYGHRLLRELKLPQVAYEQVRALEPAHLEEVVRQIADPYLLHVERMGWFGAVVAVPATWLAFILQ